MQCWGKKDCAFTCDPAACLFLISLLELFHAGRGGCVEGFIAGRLPHDADSREFTWGRSEGFCQPSSHSVSVESQMVFGPCPAFDRRREMQVGVVLQLGMPTCRRSFCFCWLTFLLL